jgi:hypothetical protein
MRYWGPVSIYTAWHQNKLSPVPKLQPHYQFSFFTRIFCVDVSLQICLTFTYWHLNTYPYNFFLWQRKTGTPTECSHLLFVTLYVNNLYPLEDIVKENMSAVKAIAELRTLSVSLMSLSSVL